jgi:hypothetical protein
LISVTDHTELTELHEVFQRELRWSRTMGLDPRPF